MFFMAIFLASFSGQKGGTRLVVPPLGGLGLFDFFIWVWDLFRI